MSSQPVDNGRPIPVALRHGRRRGGVGSPGPRVGKRAETRRRDLSIPPTKGSIALSSTERSAQPDRWLTAGGMRRLRMMLLLCTLAGGGAAAFGFLEASGDHPTLKLSMAMVVAGLGTASIMVGRPAHLSSRTARDVGRHLALVEEAPAVVVLAIASMATALIHFAVIEQHFSEYVLYGWFFIALGTAEVAWAIWLIGWPSARVLLAGAAGNLLVVAVWVVSRTYGSLIGPEASSPAKVGFGDVVSTALEIAIVVGCLVLARTGTYRDRADSYRQETLALTVGLGLTLLTVLALFSAVGGHPFVSHVG